MFLNKAFFRYIKCTREIALITLLTFPMLTNAATRKNDEKLTKREKTNPEQTEQNEGQSLMHRELLAQLKMKQNGTLDINKFQLAAQKTLEFEVGITDYSQARIFFLESSATAKPSSYETELPRTELYYLVPVPMEYPTGFMFPNVYMGYVWRLGSDDSKAFGAFSLKSDGQKWVFESDRLNNRGSSSPKSEKQVNTVDDIVNISAEINSARIKSYLLLNDDSIPNGAAVQTFLNQYLRTLSTAVVYDRNRFLKINHVTPQGIYHLLAWIGQQGSEIWRGPRISEAAELRSERLDSRQTAVKPKHFIQELNLEKAHGLIPISTLRHPEAAANIDKLALELIAKNEAIHDAQIRAKKAEKALLESHSRKERLKEIRQYLEDSCEIKLIK